MRGTGGGERGATPQACLQYHWTNGGTPKYGGANSAVGGGRRRERAPCSSASSAIARRVGRVMTLNLPIDDKRLVWLCHALWLCVASCQQIAGLRPRERARS